MKLTADIKPEWDPIAEELLKVLRRLQSASKTGGCAVIKIALLVDSEGTPHCWTAPEVIRLEPKASCTSNLIGEDAIEVLAE